MELPALFSLKYLQIKLVIFYLKSAFNKRNQWFCEN